MSAEGQLFTLSAPSGAGKSTLIRAIRARMPDLGYSVSHTTRRPRGEEQDGRDYHFVDQETFERMVREEAFVEWARVYDACYGTSFAGLEAQTSLGRDVLLDLDTVGAAAMKRRHPGSVLIFVVPPSLGSLEARLRNRGTDSEEVVRRRMEEAPLILDALETYDYLVVNETVEVAVREIEAIIVSERCRTSRRRKEVLRAFGRQAL